MSRYQRQILLSGFGEAGQEKLKKAKILVIGAGGLGCPALLYLAAAGIGNIGIVDGDHVDVSNLNRQVIFGEGDIGKLKAEIAGNYLQQKYSDIKVDVYPEFITVQNCLEIMAPYDVVIDGSDNFPTRYMVNDACVLLQKALVLGAIYQFEGQVAVLNVGTGSANYRDIYPKPPAAHEIPNCSQTGVLGVLPGIIGTLQAAEAIKLISGLGKPLINKMLFYNLKDNSIFQMEISRKLETNSTPQSIEAFGKMNYSRACSAADSISWVEAHDLLNAPPKKILLLDVREKHELPKLNSLSHINIPLSLLGSKVDEIAEASTILVFCQSGIRSLKAVHQLKDQIADKEVYSIEGGITHPRSPVNCHSTWREK
jgi:sulfur-carrier protein adenylyltransferase/sulfurtransferase